MQARTRLSLLNGGVLIMREVFDNDIMRIQWLSILSSRTKDFLELKIIDRVMLTGYSNSRDLA